MKVINKILSLPHEFFYTWGYFLIAFALFFEALPFFGIFIPGQMFLFISGFLAKLGILSLKWVLIIGLGAAAVGDITAYLMGKKYGYEFLHKYKRYFFFHHTHLKKTKETIKKHLAETLIVARLNSITRAFAPFIAGSTKIKFRKFFLYDVLVGEVWSFAFIILGYLFGESYEIISRILQKSFLVLILIAILTFYFYQFFAKRQKAFSKEFAAIFIIFLTSTYLFIQIFINILENGLLSQFDTIANNAIKTAPLLLNFFKAVTQIFSPEILIAVSSIIILFLLIKKEKRKAVILGASILLGIFIQAVIKTSVKRMRPLAQLVTEKGFSFPSGHAVISIIFFFALVYIFQDKLKTKVSKTTAGLILLIVPTLVSFSRVYLKVHWVSDVMAGFFLGLSIVTTIILLVDLFIPFVKEVLKEKNVKKI